MLIDKIKADQLNARKARNTVETDVLTTLLGEVTIIGKNDGNRETTDDEAKNAIIKFHKNLSETYQLQKKRGDTESALTKTETEIGVIERYMPKQLSEAELSTIISRLAESLGVSSPKDTGRLMKAINADYKGQYNGQVCKRLIDVYFAL